ncbi:PAS domain-containing sensor histidine kinase [Fibrella arboris]|uniref:PAS domain-containing sensor histidine kinase n=1 Tax=Fibrella arboris TaxID=3242486 RepID=UPI003522802D
MSDQPIQPTALTDRLDIDFALQAAGLGVWEMDPVTYQINWDDRCRQLFGMATNGSLPYDQAIQFIHPDDVSRVDQAVRWAMNPDSGGTYDVTYRTLGATDGVLRWVRFHGRGYFSATGEVYRFAGVAQEVTEQMQAHQQLQQSEARSSSIVQQTPAATLVLLGDDFRIAHVNQAMLLYMNRGEEVIGQPLLAVMPELDGQFAWQQVLRVYREGITIDQDEVLVSHRRSGILQNFYYRVSYRPLWEDGRVVGMIQVAADITDQVANLRRIVESEEQLQGAMAMADIGAWQLDMTTGVITYSERLKQLFEFKQDYIEMAIVYNPIHERDRHRIEEAVLRASTPDSGGLLDEEYTIVTQQTHKERLVRAQAKMYFDEQGKPLKMIGSMRDITEERRLQLALEQQVQDRTEELDGANEELTATNEELLASYDEMAATNRELNESNRLLSRSNENLQQFAYVASHDLQEPLRKIESFGKLLWDQHAEDLGEGVDYLKRMQDAASRMSILIRDLLAYSRIAVQQENRTPVSLNAVADQVLLDLDMLIEETKAVVTIAPLPTVMGDATQLKQVFQNLLSNALKFRQAGMAPQVWVSSRLLTVGSLPPAVNLIRSADVYHRIDVRDNGIGFDPKYLDRIFQVFQRLHGKNHYAGTGIGLAICEKVAANHGGAITASSQPGQGATFSVYLPA